MNASNSPRETVIEVPGRAPAFLAVTAVLCKVAAGIVFAALIVAAIFVGIGIIKAFAIAWVILTAGFWMFRWETIASARRNTETQQT